MTSQKILVKVDSVFRRTWMQFLVVGFVGIWLTAILGWLKVPDPFIAAGAVTTGILLISAGVNAINNA